MIQLEIDEQLIFLDMQYLDKLDAIKKMAQEMHIRGYVKKIYAEAVLKREEEFPTGLPEEGLGFAIPHAESEYVIKSAIAVAVLSKPVKFNLMGSIDQSSEVDVIFMLAIKRPEDHISIVGKIIDFLMSYEKTNYLRTETDRSKIAYFLENSIAK